MEKNVIVINNLYEGSKGMEVVNFSNANVKFAIGALLEISPEDLCCEASSMSEAIYRVTKSYRKLKEDVQPFEGRGSKQILLQILYIKLYASPDFIPASFHLPGESRNFVGVYNPKQNWNGFVVPYFTQDEAEAILRGTSLDYRFDRLKFIIEDEDPETSPIIYEAVDINDQHMYSIGGYFWTWVLVEEEEEQEQINYYKCPDCGTKWDEVWTCGCDSECPKCDAKNISPYNSEEI